MKDWLQRFFSELFIRDRAISSGGAAELPCLAAERGPWRRISAFIRPAEASPAASSAPGLGCAACDAAPGSVVP